MKKFVSLICGVFFSFALVACGTTEDDFSQTDDPPDDVHTYVYDAYYNFNDASFAKLTINSIDEKIYERIPKNPNAYTISHYILLRCVVEEDFYGKIESGSEINLPIRINSGRYTYYDEETVKEWFYENDTVLVYFRTTDKRFALKEVDKAEAESIYPRTDGRSLDSIDIIPIRGNKVDLESLYDLVGEEASISEKVGFSHKYYVKLTDYVASGMTLEEVSQNLRRLADEAKK